MAMTTAITRRWAGEFTQSWGGTDARYYKKFWRNVVYWLTENSSIGRRRLLAETDKRLYRPGEPIVLHARTFDENAAPTLDYRVAVTVEPRSASDVTSDNSPAPPPRERGRSRQPEPRRRSSPGARNLTWHAKPSEKSYDATLPIAEAKSLPPGVTLTQGLRIELTAYENNTQVDSTSLEVQIIDDPSEQQNPLPDHDLLRRIAEQSGGTVLNGAKDLSAMIERLPRVAGPPEVKKTPAWSVWSLVVASDRFAHHRMDLAAACRPGVIAGRLRTIPLGDCPMNPFPGLARRILPTIVVLLLAHPINTHCARAQDSATPASKDDDRAKRLEEMRQLAHRVQGGRDRRKRSDTVATGARTAAPLDRPYATKQ